MARLHHIHIEGCSPYGFRLIGGSGQPVVITKLRAKSKAATAGVLEGDIVLAINGRTCDDVTHERLISLVEHAGHSLDLDIHRKSLEYSKSSSYQLRHGHVTGLRDSRTAPVSSYDAVIESDSQTAWAVGGGRVERLGHRPSLPSDTERRRQLDDSNQQQQQPAVSVTWNPADRSLTMALDLSTSLTRSTSTPRHRTESFIVINDAQRLPTTQYLQQPCIPAPPHQPVLSSLQLAPLLPAHVLKILTPATDPQSIQSLSPTASRKKVFADSSFYDDPSHHYPTVEEQIKMARTVAQSLTSSANQLARGQEMFLKRQQKSMAWTTDNDDVNITTTKSPEHKSRELDDIYYNPTPWMSSISSGGKVLETGHNTPPTAPTPPPFLLKHFTWTKETADMDGLELNGEAMMSRQHQLNPAAPQLCFSLAAQLRQSTDKGGRMFAKRRAKADQWTVEAVNHQQQQQPVAGNSESEIPTRRARLSSWLMYTEPTNNADFISDQHLMHRPKSTTVTYSQQRFRPTVYH